jgi:hypothetical protein
MKDANGCEIAIGDRAIVVDGSKYAGRKVWVRAFGDAFGRDVVLIDDGYDSTKDWMWSAWAHSHRIAVVKGGAE